LRAHGQLGSAGLRHDEAVLDVVGGQAFESRLAAVCVDELAQERKGGAVDWKYVGIRRGCTHSGRLDAVASNAGHLKSGSASCALLRPPFISQGLEENGGNWAAFSNMKGHQREEESLLRVCVEEKQGCRVPVRRFILNRFFEP
jgi:hypothetical protein